MPLPMASQQCCPQGGLPAGCPHQRSPAESHFQAPDNEGGWCQAGGGGGLQGILGVRPGASPPSLSPHPEAYSGKGPLRLPAPKPGSANSRTGAVLAVVVKDGAGQGSLLPQHHTQGLQRPASTPAQGLGREVSPPGALPWASWQAAPCEDTGPAGLVGPGSADRARAHFLHTAPSSPLPDKTPF